MDGEFDLIARLRAVSEASGAATSEPVERILLGSGDDAAVTVPRGATATSVDAIVDGVHFRLGHTPPRSVGHKALSAALSDLAAMGADGGEAYVIVGVPPGLDADALEEVGAGLAAVAADHAVAILGGDITRAPALWLGVTVVGHAGSADELVSRGGATPGDLVGITGELGGATAGLALLETPRLADTLDATVADALRRRQLEPQPRIAAGRALAAAGAKAMIDVSDGLGADAVHLAAASGVQVEIEIERVPVQPGVHALAEAAALDPVELAISGGEDYELLVTTAPDAFGAAAEATASAGVTLTRIGWVGRGEGAIMRTRDGARRAPLGFDHLRRDRSART